MNSYFVVVALAMFVAVQAITSQERETIKVLTVECIEETGADLKLLLKVLAGDWTMEDAKLKSYTFCMMKKIGIMTEDGVIHKDVAVEKSEPLERVKVEQAMTKCMKLVGATKEETAWNVFKCYQAENPHHGLY